MFFRSKVHVQTSVRHHSQLFTRSVMVLCSIAHVDEVLLYISGAILGETERTTSYHRQCLWRVLFEIKTTCWSWYTLDTDVTLAQEFPYRKTLARVHIQGYRLARATMQIQEVHYNWQLSVLVLELNVFILLSYRRNTGVTGKCELISAHDDSNM